MMVEQAVITAMQYFAGVLKPNGKNWDILEVNANGSREFHNLFGKGNDYKSMSTINLGGVDYYVERPDLSEFPEIKDKSFDIVLHTLTLQQTWGYRKSLEESFRILKPGGFLIVNCPWICENRGDKDYWRISHYALSRMLDEIGFDHGRVALWNDTLTAGIARRPK